MTPNKTKIDRKFIIKRQELQQTADLYKSFQNDWLDKGSKAVSDASYKNATQFIASYPDTMEAPGIMLTNEGEIGFYWDMNSGVYADLHFEEGGVASFFARNRAGQEIFVDKILSESINAKWVKEIFSSIPK